VLCLLPLFCSQYERITAELNSSRFRLELGILSATAWDISTECPQGQLHLPDAEMLDAIEAMYKPGKGNCKFCEPKTSRINAIKLWYLGLVQYDMIFYMDLDIDVARVVPSQVLNSVLTFHRLPVAIAAAADWASPINTGIMLFRPSATRYRQMLKLLKTGIFDGSTFNGTGFGRVGRPKQLLSGPLPSNYMSTRMFTHDSWDTVSGDSDQGFFTWYALLDGASQMRTMKVNHFWAADKPFRCRRWVRAANSSLSSNSSCFPILDHWLRNSNDVCKHHRQYI